MIGTKIVNQLPMIVHHRVTGLLSVDEAKSGAVTALSVVRQAVDLGSRLHLLLDMRGCIFDDLESHKIWAIDFKQNSLLTEHVDCVAVVGDPSPNLFAEKEMMETEVHKFFTDFNLASEWLQNQDIAASDLTK